MKQDNNSAFTRLRVLVPLAVSLTLLSACSNRAFRPEQPDAGKQDRIITVTSNPPGATVRANGDRLGETPLKVNIDKSFPSRWVRAEDYGIAYRVSGKLTIGKSGCDDYTVPVSPTAPAGDIDVTLVCTQEKPAPGAAAPEVKPAPDSAGTAAPVLSGTTEQRLKQLDKLYRDDVISADEYKQHRNRILNEL